MEGREEGRERGRDRRKERGQKVGEGNGVTEGWKGVRELKLTNNSNKLQVLPKKHRRCH